MATKMEATNSFYSEGGEHFNIGEQIDLSVYSNLSENDKKHFKEAEIPEDTHLASHPGTTTIETPARSDAS